MDKTYQTELRRAFLIAELPEPLTRASQHLQIFDNYIGNTRMRLRSVRAPHTKEWTFVLQQRFPLDESDLSKWKTAQIYLNEAEHAAFEHFEGREIRKNERAESSEIRKNRYFYDLDGRQIEIDLYLGDLWGLQIAKAYFETEEETQDFELPPFAILDVTHNRFFTGENLVGKTFTDVKAEFEKHTTIELRQFDAPD